MEYSENDKLQHEVEKLIEEVKALRRPYILQPSSWLAVVGLTISIIVNLSQCSDVQSAKLLATIQVAQSKLDADKISRSNDSLKKVGDSLKMVRISLANDDSILQEKYIAGKKQFDSLQIKINGTQQLLSQLTSNASNVGPSVIKVISELKISLDSLSNINQNASKSFIKNTTTNLPLAKEKEREGFQNLLNGNYDKAETAFRESENAYNGYHNVYELARFIKVNKTELYNSPNKRKEVIQFILNNYSKSIPQDFIEELKKTAKE